MKHRPRKRFGQHFLESERILSRMASVMALRPADALIEIGPGEGALTSLLASEVGKFRVVEPDRDLAATLAERFPNVDLINGDILSVPAATLFDGAPRWRIVGNLPYNISTPLLGRMLDDLDWIVDMHFLLQREVVNRLAARPGTKDWGRLSVMAQLRLEVEPLFEVEPHHFRPPPKVVSTFVRLLPRTSPVPLHDPVLFNRVVSVAFQQRRKRLSNALESFAIDWNHAPVDAGLRPDAVGLEGYVDLTNFIAERVS